MLFRLVDATVHRIDGICPVHTADFSLGFAVIFCWRISLTFIFGNAVRDRIAVTGSVERRPVFPFAALARAIVAPIFADVQANAVGIRRFAVESQRFAFRFVTRRAERQHVIGTATALGSRTHAAFADAFFVKAACDDDRTARILFAYARLTRLGFDSILG